MVDKREHPNVTQLTKVRPPPLWTRETFECYKDQVQNWNSNNKDNDLNKFSDFVEKL